MALGKEKDEASAKRLAQVQVELAAVREQLQPLKLRFEQERGAANELGDLKKKVQLLEAKIVTAERKRDMQTASDLKYGALPDLMARIAALEVQEREAAASAASMDVDEEDAPLVSDVVTAEAIAEVVARWTGIPVQSLSKSERQKLLELPAVLKERVVGQDEAVEVVCDAIMRSRAGLKNPRQPVAALLFAGASGTGKTELARALASQLYDSDKALIRIDCSELQDRHSGSKLIGSPAGYVGYDDPALLEKLRRAPHAVLLLDEIEKAHVDVLNLFLQALDNGFLTDTHGRRIDFSNAVIIATSNLGSSHIVANGVTAELSSAAVMAAVQAHFRPEFLNRLDQVVVFNLLTPEVLGHVVRMQVAELVGRLQERDIAVSVDSAAAQLVVQEAYDPAYGARPIRRWLERHFVNQLARAILRGDLPDHSDVVVTVSGSQELAFHVQPSDRVSSPPSKRPRTEL